MPFLGLCYGIGMLGSHQGGIVDRTFGEPVGRMPVTVTAAGQADPLFEGLPEQFEAFGGHKEALSVTPPHAVVLATSAACPVQAFRAVSYTHLDVYKRQLHPPVLTDRGLDAALSAVAARSPVPVDIVVDLPVRPPMSAEATIYFAVLEALTNVAKHSGAGRASVSIRRSGELVVTTITDEGRGGADASKGSGLRGIMDLSLIHI